MENWIFLLQGKDRKLFCQNKKLRLGRGKKIENHIRKKVYFLGLKISSSHKSPSYLEFKKDRKELKDLKDELRSLKQEIYDSSFEFFYKVYGGMKVQAKEPSLLHNTFYFVGITRFLRSNLLIYLACQRIMNKNQLWQD